MVSFRLPDDDEARLRAAGLMPGALAKNLVEAELRRLDVEDNLAALARLARTPHQPVEATIRHIREET